MGIIFLIGCTAFVVAGILLPETRNRLMRAAERANDVSPAEGTPPAVRPS